MDGVIDFIVLVSFVLAILGAFVVYPFVCGWIAYKFFNRDKN